MVENVFPSEQPKVKSHCNTLFKERLPMLLESTQEKQEESRRLEEERG